MQTIDKISYKIFNCIRNVDFPGQNIFSQGLMNEVRERIDTDAYLIAEEDKFSRHLKEYWNISAGNLIYSLTNTAYDNSDEKINYTGELSPLTLFIKEYARPDITMKLIPSKNDLDLIEKIVKESEKSH